ncbi:MAG: siderophore-interacting protein [Leucobacter sp.]
MTAIQPTDALPPFAVLHASVSRTEQVSPTFVRITFTGPDLDELGTPGHTFDQRIKIVFPPAGGVLPSLSDAGADWYAAWRALPDEVRGAMRTYSLRDLQRGTHGTTAVIDFVLHLEPGETGPAAEWASTARVDDEVLIVGPRRDRLDGGGIEFAPAAGNAVVLVGDETAAPAIARILEDADPSLQGTALIEVPDPGDHLPIAAPEGVRVRWLTRGDQPHGSALIPALTSHLGAMTTLEVHDAQTDQPIWETPNYSNLADESPQEHQLSNQFFWIAGESGVVTTLRRYLVKTLHVHRAQIAFMGYWRRGTAMGS